MKINYKEWPVLLLSDEIHNNNDVGHRIRELINKLKDEYDCYVIPSVTIKDAKDIILSRADIGTCNC